MNRAAGHVIRSIMLIASLLPVSERLSCLPGENQELNLQTMLKKCEGYCERLSNTVLSLVCVEKVIQDAFHGRPVALVSSSSSPYVMSTRTRPERKEFRYDYQLLKRNNEIREIRRLLDKDGRPEGKEAVSLKDLRFEHKNIIMGPIGVMGGNQQKHYDYRLVKKTQFNNIETWIIEVLPKPGYESDNLDGRVWISQKDGSILKIEWNQQSIKGYETLIEECKRDGLEPFITLTSEYMHIKNGIRFPSRYELMERYSYRGNRKFTASKKIVTYEDYRFFTVETHVKY